MLFDYANVLVFALFGIGFVLMNLLLSKVLAPKAPSFEKSIPYECGELPIGSPWIRFNPRYYMFALIFLIFDVEIAFMYPCAAVFKDWVKRGNGVAAFVEIFVFLSLLMAGLVYVWKCGDLEWVKTLATTDEESPRKAVNE